MKRNRSIFKNQQGYLIQLDYPGVTKENLDISIEKNRLTITSTRNLPKDPLIYGHSPREKHKNSYLFDPTIDPEAITADLKNGILSITLPKKSNRRTITINA